uniref:(northern house mosquito) hypothetical protein n=1 Tax=Culex pipiens TaxID=7175 RepID=A0A8D8DHN4_CULPI
MAHYGVNHFIDLFRGGIIAQHQQQFDQLDIDDLPAGSTALEATLQQTNHVDRRQKIEPVPILEINHHPCQLQHVPPVDQLETDACPVHHESQRGIQQGLLFITAQIVQR